MKVRGVSSARVIASRPLTSITIASVMLPLSKIWKFKSYLPCNQLFQRAVSIAAIVQNMKLDRELLESLYF